jgi:hypothetical protein
VGAKGGIVRHQDINRSKDKKVDRQAESRKAAFYGLAHADFLLFRRDTMCDINLLKLVERQSDSLPVPLGDVFEHLATQTKKPGLDSTKTCFSFGKNGKNEQQ